MRPIQIEMPVPFPLATVNAWLFPGREPALVDCGIGAPGGFEALIAAIRKAGVDPADLSLYLSHGHVDHAGNARRLLDAHGVRLIAPREESGYVETFRRDSKRRNDEFAAALTAHGMTPADVGRLRADSDAIDAFLDDCPIDEDLADGAQLDLGDSRLTAMRTPGHTPGSTCYVHDDYILTGDTLLQTITSNAVELRDADHGNYHRYVASLESLRTFVGLECLPGHRAAFPLTDEVLDHHIGHHEKRRAKLLAGMDAPITAFRLMRATFPHWTSDAQLFMGMAEVVGHLHAMQLDGLVHRTEEAGVRRFQAR